MPMAHAVAGASSTLSISLKDSHKRKTAVDTHQKVNFDISPLSRNNVKKEEMFMNFEDTNSKD